MGVHKLNFKAVFFIGKHKRSAEHSNIRTERDQAGSDQCWMAVVRQPTESLVVTAEECENVT